MLRVATTESGAQPWGSNTTASSSPPPGGTSAGPSPSGSPPGQRRSTSSTTAPATTTDRTCSPSASDAHDAFHAATSAQAGSTEILSRRLREHGVRVISLYPPDFDDHDPLSPQWEGAPRPAKDPRTAQSPVDCIFFAVGRPRDCFIKSFHFEQV